MSDLCFHSLSMVSFINRESMLNEPGISVHCDNCAFVAELWTNAQIFSPNDIKVLLVISFILK